MSTVWYVAAVFAAGFSAGAWLAWTRGGAAAFLLGDALRAVGKRLIALADRLQ